MTNFVLSMELQQYLLKDQEEKSPMTAKPVEETEVKTPSAAPAEEVLSKTEEAPVVESIKTAPAPEESSEAVTESAEASPPVEASSDESSESTEDETSGDQESAVETPAIKLETAPADFRFPTTNQSRHCFTRYVEYHRCTAAKGEGAPECDKFAKYYRSLCPGEWVRARAEEFTATTLQTQLQAAAGDDDVDRWNEQRENGTFPGPL
uniref:Cytochrome c oxidase subunit 6b-1 n=1 Tax=Solanum lycopersicum TaxID=4081 RepID=A0A3Q7G500_SOLLC